MSEYSDLILTFLISFFIKMLFDFKNLGGFNYPLLIKIVYMIMIIFVFILIFHFLEIKNALNKTIRQTRIEEYFKKTIK